MPSSNDLIFDRRFAWAQATAAQGELVAAADLYAQIVAERPDWAAAWFQLGETRLALNDRAGAAEAYRRALARDPADLVGAGVALAALGAGKSVMNPAFVARLFDDYAPRFEEHLLGALGYRAPEVLVMAIDRVGAARGRPARFLRCLDLGCGSGLFGAALDGRAAAIEGVDLAAEMIALARRKSVYERLVVGELLTFLQAAPPASADLVAAADVFTYLGDLDPVFAAARRALAAGGLFAFTTQAREGEGFAIGPDRRFAHARVYLEHALEAAGFAVDLCADISTRLDRGQPAPGFVVVASAGA